MTAWDIDDATARLMRALANVKTGEDLRGALRAHLDAAHRAGLAAVSRDRVLTPAELDEMSPPPRGRLGTQWRS